MSNKIVGSFCFCLTVLVTLLQYAAANNATYHGLITASLTPTPALDLAAASLTKPLNSSSTAPSSSFSPSSSIPQTQLSSYTHPSSPTTSSADRHRPSRNSTASARDTGSHPSRNKTGSPLATSSLPHRRPSLVGNSTASNATNSRCPQQSQFNYSSDPVPTTGSGLQYAAQCNAVWDEWASASSAWSSGLVTAIEPSYTTYVASASWPLSVKNNSFYATTYCDGYPRVNAVAPKRHDVTMFTSTFTTSSMIPQFTKIRGCHTNAAFAPSPSCSIQPKDCLSLYQSSAIQSYYVQHPHCSCPGGLPCHDQITASKKHQCTIGASAARLYYWPETTTGSLTCTGTGDVSYATIAPPSAPRTALLTVGPSDLRGKSSVLTLVSPTVYLSLHNLGAVTKTRIFDLAADADEALTTKLGTVSNINTMYALPPGQLSSVVAWLPGYTGDYQDLVNMLVTSRPTGPGPYITSAMKSSQTEYFFNLTRTVQGYELRNLQRPVPASAYFLGADVWEDNIYPYAGTTIYNHYHARIAVPPGLRALDPSWANCRLDLGGIFDPPVALSAASAMATPTLSFSPIQIPPTPGPTVVGPPGPTTTPDSSTNPGSSGNSPGPGPPGSGNSGNGGSGNGGSGNGSPDGSDGTGNNSGDSGSQGGVGTGDNFPSSGNPSTGTSDSSPAPGDGPLDGPGNASGDGSAPTAVITPAPGAAPITASQVPAVIDGTTFTNAVSIDGTTLVPGGAAATIGGTTFSIPPDGNGIIVGGVGIVPFNTPAAGAVAPVAVITPAPGAPPLTASHVAAVLDGTTFSNAVALDGTTLVPGGAAMTIDGTTYSEAPNGALVLNGTSTIAIPQPSGSGSGSGVAAALMSLLSQATEGAIAHLPSGQQVAAALLHAPNSAGARLFAVASTTLSAGGPPATVSGHVLSIADAGLVMDGTSTAAWSMISAAGTPAWTAPSATATAAAATYTGEATRSTMAGTGLAVIAVALHGIWALR